MKHFKKYWNESFDMEIENWPIQVESMTVDWSKKETNIYKNFLKTEVQWFF